MTTNQQNIAEDLAPETVSNDNDKMEAVTLAEPKVALTYANASEKDKKTIDALLVGAENGDVTKLHAELVKFGTQLNGVVEETLQSISKGEADLDAISKQAGDVLGFLGQDKGDAVRKLIEGNDSASEQIEEKDKEKDRGILKSLAHVWGKVTGSNSKKQKKTPREILASELKRRLGTDVPESVVDEADKLLQEQLGEMYETAAEGITPEVIKEVVETQARKLARTFIASLMDDVNKVTTDLVGHEQQLPVMIKAFEVLYGNLGEMAQDNRILRAAVQEGITRIENEKKMLGSQTGVDSLSNDHKIALLGNSASNLQLVERRLDSEDATLQQAAFQILAIAKAVQTAQGGIENIKNLNVSQWKLQVSAISGSMITSDALRVTDQAATLSLRLQGAGTQMTKDMLEQTTSLQSAEGDTKALEAVQTFFDTMKETLESSTETIKQSNIAYVKKAESLKKSANGALESWKGFQDSASLKQVGQGDINEQNTAIESAVDVAAAGSEKTEHVVQAPQEPK